MSNNVENTELEDLGYNDFFELKRKSLGLTDYAVARVIAEYKEAYKVKSVKGEYLAKLTGKQIFSATRREDYPSVGDWVAITELNDGKAVINEILPRRTVIKKKYSDKQNIQVIAANIDFAFVVESVDRDYNLNRLERYFTIASDGNIKFTIILNKIDLISDGELNLKINQIKNRFKDIDIIQTSTITKHGINELANYMVGGKTYCLLGSSGVGKSSLINCLLGKEEIKTREIGGSTGRGKHTTTAREMYFLENGGIVIDNPGIREVGIADASAGLDNVFEEINILSKNCKYADCTHMHEPGCSVMRAIEDKKLDENKYQNYIKLKKKPNTTI